MLINIKTKELVNEPAFRNMHRDISLPAYLSNEVLEPYGFARFTYTSHPQYDAETQKVREERTIVDGEWSQVWIVEDIEFTSEELEQRLRQKRGEKILEIDAHTQESIFAGFDYAIDGVTYHFSYDSFDQQNFADTANVCLLKMSGVEGLPESVNWNMYTLETHELVIHTFTPSEFLDLYTQGALVHKNTVMSEGGLRKANAEAAKTLEELEQV